MITKIRRWLSTQKLARINASFPRNLGRSTMDGKLRYYGWQAQLLPVASKTTMDGKLPVLTFRPQVHRLWKSIKPQKEYL